MYQNKVLKVSILPILLFSVLEVFSFFTSEVSIYDQIKITEDCYDYNFPCNEPIFNLNDTTVVLEDDYEGFKEAVGFKESQSNYTTINEFGYLGKYQFGITTLQLIGVYSAEHFLNSPELQEKAFYAYVSRNKWVLRKYIAQYNGKVVNGIKITESGILAAAHLAGPGSVKRFFKTNGKKVTKDNFGTTVVEYMKKFAGYNLSDIPANRKAKA